MFLTENEEAYLHHVAPGAFNNGHFALLELRDVGETRILQDGKELGHLVLSGSKSCDIYLWDTPTPFDNPMKIFRFEIAA